MRRRTINAYPPPRRRLVPLANGKAATMMTRFEAAELCKLVRQRERVAKMDAASHAAAIARCRESIGRTIRMGD